MSFLHATSRPGSPDAPDAAAATRLAAGWRRVRVGVYAAFALIAANAIGQAWQAERLSDSRTLAAEVIADAGRHRTLVQRLGRLAALVELDPTPSAPSVSLLGQELAQSRQDALQLQPRLELVAGEPFAGQPGLLPAIDRWDVVRERLWYRAEALLGHVDGERPEAVTESSRAVQREADAAAQAAADLVAALQRHSHELGEQAARWAQIGAGATVGLLLLMALAVVGPALRVMQGQARRLSRQAAENERLALVAEVTDNLVLVTDRERRLVWANAAFTRVTGYELHEVLGRSPGELLQSPRTDPDTVLRVRAALHDGRGIRAEFLNRSRDGRDYWIDADIQPLHDADGRLSGFIAVETVITEQVTRRLRDASLLAALPAAVVVHDAAGAVVEANAAAREMLDARLGDGADALLRRVPLHDDLEPLTADELPVAHTLRAGRGDRGRIVGIDDGEGGRRWLLVNTEPLHDAFGAADGVVACYMDISERRRLLEQLREAARRDPLTQMPNRSVVLERVQRAMEHHARHPEYGFAVLFMDVDRFKQVNDTFGHGAGDDLLRQVAERLNETLRPGDTVARIGSDLHTAARIGGDEFVVVLEGVRHVDEACAVADRLLAELSQPYRLGGHTVHVTLSIGIVGAEQAATDAGAVLRDCDTAMYEAKRAGRGCWRLFDRSMHERVKSALELEGELRRALGADELYVVYQPVVDLGDRSLSGVEALVRWRHPERGEVPPGRFVPLAEECGLIDAIGDFVLDRACRQFAAWQQQWGHRAPRLLAVNLSRAQLRQPGLVPEVRALLEANGMRPDQLQLEVTESFAAQDEQMQAMLRALKGAGVRLALDDFGTGYSSLACLHQLPVDTVKVDRSFVAHARDIEYHRVLIQATIKVARALGMTTVAEGIETEDQAELMQDLACDRGQGWLFGRPMTADALDRWIEHQAADTVA